MKSGRDADGFVRAIVAGIAGDLHAIGELDVAVDSEGIAFCQGWGAESFEGIDEFVARIEVDDRGFSLAFRG